MSGNDTRARGTVRRWHWVIRAVTAGTAGLLAASGAAAGAQVSAAGASATHASAAGPSWHIVKQVPGGNFTAVVATGKTSGWAFDATSTPTAYQRSGSTWKRVAFPGQRFETVVAAGATSPGSVWAFTDQFAGGSRVLHWDGRRWSVVKTFAKQIGGAAVLRDNSVWVFGEPYAPANGLGAWYYNGHAWTQFGKNQMGGSVLSARDVWAFNGALVYHWNGRTWSAVSVARLLPAKQFLNSPAVTGIIALSAKDVYAIGNGNRQDEGGPVVVLHYNGRTWSKVAQGEYGYGAGQQIAADGRGGLWLPMPGPLGGPSHLAHYAAGKLTAASLPVGAQYIYVDSIARIPGTTQQLVGGFTHAKGNPGRNIAAVLLQYS
jgi:hypothetical protein